MYYNQLPFITVIVDNKFNLEFLSYLENIHCRYLDAATPIG